MKRPTPYLLVRKPTAAGAGPDATRKVEGKTQRKLKPAKDQPKEAGLSASQIGRHPKLKKGLAALNPALRRSLLDSIAPYVMTIDAEESAKATRVKGFRSVAGGNSHRLDRARSEAYLEAIAEVIGAQTRVERIGILDLGAWIGGLPDLLGRLNRAQNTFSLFEIVAAVPGGLRKTSVGMVDWLRSFPVSEALINESTIDQHVVATEFFEVASDIGTAMGLDTIVGLTPALVAGTSGDSVFWNHFSSVGKGCALLSTADLRQFSKEAARPFEAAIGVLLVGALAVRYIGSLGYHQPDRGCVLDYNRNRVGLVNTIRNLKFCPECLAKMNTSERRDLKAMLSALRRMRRRKV